MSEKRKPLNPRIRISPRGVPYVERQTLVKERLERISAPPNATARVRQQIELIIRTSVGDEYLNPLLIERLAEYVALREQQTKR